MFSMFLPCFILLSFLVLLVLYPKAKYTPCSCRLSTLVGLLYDIVR